MAIKLSIEFPLGVYHAQSPSNAREPEWPPHPVRLVGALVAAANSTARAATRDADLDLTRRIAEADPPVIGGPKATPNVNATDGETVPMLRGASRWAPRNYFTKGREQASVDKGGVAIGDLPLWFDWPDLELDEDDQQRLAQLVADVSFLGSTRSPVIVRSAGDAASQNDATWRPAGESAGVATISVRVPDVRTLDAFESRHEARKSSKATIESATMAVPGVRIGREEPYAHSTDLGEASRTFDPKAWGAIIALAIDTETSAAVPLAEASYSLARAVRTALLGSYADSGEPGEAPAILRGRNEEPHCAFLALSEIWHSGQVKGVAIVLPHRGRVPDLAMQRDRVEQGLASLLPAMGSTRRFARVPGVGTIWLRQPTPDEAANVTLRASTYIRPSRTWVSATPVVYSRWLKRGDSLFEQVARDCSHVGLPAPIRVEEIRGRAFPKAASHARPPGQLPERWLSTLNGPSGHLRITFDVSVTGPILLGRARHFGLGLMVPDSRTAESREEGR